MGLQEAGYVVHWEVLAAYANGVPQMRRRLYIIAVPQLGLPHASIFCYPEPKHRLRHE